MDFQPCGRRDLLRLSFLAWIGGSLRKCGLGQRAEVGDEYGHGQYCARLSLAWDRQLTTSTFHLPT